MEGDKKRRKRELQVTTAAQDSRQVGLNKAIQVIAFPLEMALEQDKSALVSKQSTDENSICIPTIGVVVPIAFVCLACVISTLLVTLRVNVKKTGKVSEKGSAHKLPNLYEMIRVN